MTESEVRSLCLKSREIFLSQPILLELEAPLKICGKLKSSLPYYMNILNFLRFQEISMVNTQIYCDYSNTAVFLPRRTICFWGTMSIVENNLLKLSVYWWHIRLNILKTFSYSEEITSVLVSTESTVSMMNVRLVSVHFSLLFLYFDA